MIGLTGDDRAPYPAERPAPRSARWKAGAIGAASGLIAFMVYLVTMPPTLTWAQTHYGADGGDLVTAVVRGSIPHPPGFPTYLLLGELFIRLPLGEPAWRLNLMSAVLAAGTVGLTTVAIQGLLSTRAAAFGLPAVDRSLPLAALTGAALGLSPLFWSQALIAEVYAPAAFCTALVIALALRRGPPWALGLAWGAGLGMHPVLLFLAPLVIWGAWESSGRGPRRLGLAGLLALLAWGTLYGPVLLARSAPSPWADVSTTAGWWALVSGRLYHGYLFGLPAANWPQRVLAWAGLLARQMALLGVPFAGLGWLALWQEQRPLAVASALAFGTISLYAIGYDTADSLVYLVPALPLMALCMGAGLARVVGWLGHRMKHIGWLRHTAWALLLLPLLQALLSWRQMDLSGDRAAMTWAQQVLQQAPTGAVLLTERDDHTFALWYALDVLDERPDVTVIDRDLWGQEAYRQMAAKALGIESGADGLTPEEAADRAGRPAVSIIDHLTDEGDEP